MISAREHIVGPAHETGLAPGPYVCLAVTDKGEGMSAETVVRATEPFFTTKGVGKGTGLGLSMVHGMSEQMGGRFVLHSREGEGTRAEIWLRATESAVRPRCPSRAGVPRTPRRRNPCAFSAVDDDRLVLRNSTAMLEELGHSRGGGVLRRRRALAHRCRQQAFDLLITDQAMPKNDIGTQLLEAVKAEWPGLPVILATGYAELPGGVKIEVPEILGKPFSRASFAAAVAQIAAPR